MLACVANLVAHMVEGEVIVHYAHMELAQPTISDGFAACVRDGASHVVVFPYMLSPGKHSTSDIPRMVGEVAAGHPKVGFEVTECFGVESELAHVILKRAGVAVAAAAAVETSSSRCWHPSDATHACGSACVAPVTG